MIDPRISENFWRHVMPEPNSGCWLWTGHINHDGYAYFWVSGQRFRAHRVSFEMHQGPMPQGLVTDHKCRVRCCVNPDHLRAVSNKTNVLCGEGVTARNARATHCPQGHPYDAGNTYIRPNGHRDCRTCQNRRTKAWQAKQRAIRALPLTEDAGP